MNISRILVAYDHSEQSQKALDHALELLKDNEQRSLTVIYVYEQPNLIVGEAYFPIPANVEEKFMEHAKAVLNEARRKLADAGADRADTVMRQGSPARTILEYAREQEFDMIVIGSRGMGGVKGFVLGSVSHHVVQQAEMPVLVVK